MKDIAPILRLLGLLESESKTYLTALQQGPQTALDLTKKTGLSRQAVYVAIETLSERGLMSSVLRGKKRFYAAEDPEKLLAYAKRREAEMHDQVAGLERSLPELNLQIGGERPSVRVFEGKEGIRAIIEEMAISKPKELVEIGDLDAMYSILKPEDLEPLTKVLEKGKTLVKGIYTGKQKRSPPNVERYFLPKEFNEFRSNVAIYGNTIVMITFEGKMYSVIIESAPLAKVLKILHQLALKCAIGQELK